MQRFSLCTSTKNTLTYPSLLFSSIRNHISQGSHKCALLLYKQTRREGLYDPNVVPLLFKACVSFSILHHVKALHAESIKAGSHCDVFIGTALVGTYSKCGLLGDSRKVFDTMPDRNVVTWNAMIGGYLRAGDKQSASSMFEAMPGKTPVSWSQMIDGFARNGDTAAARRLFNKVPDEAKNVVTWTVMVDGYARNGDMEAAREIFEQMPMRNCFVWSSMICGYCKKGSVEEAGVIFERVPERNVEIWNSMIAGYVQNGFGEKALQLFEEMKGEGFEPDEFTVVSVLSACSQLGLLDAGKEIHNMIKQKGMRLSPFVVSGLVDMYAKCGDLVNARLVFEASESIEKNIICWNAMISGFAINGKFHEVLECFGRLEESNIKPDPITCLIVLSACAHGGLVNEALEVAAKMERYGIEIGIRHYGCMVDLLGRAGRLKRAYDLIKRMPMKPNDAVFGALLGACRIHSDVQMAEQVMKLLGASTVSNFFVDNGNDIPEDNVGRSRLHRPLHEQDEDFEALERHIQERYARRVESFDEEATDVEQQALLPSVRDPKLWMVKCMIGRERETAVCLMQKYIDKGAELQIRSAIALDHLKNYIYVEADKEAHVREAIKGLRNIYGVSKITLVPIREMTDVLSVESKAIDLARDTWVRMKIGTYKGDLAKVVDVDNVRQRVTVKLIPRIDLQALANKLEGREVVKKKAFVPPPRFLNVDEARELHIRVEHRRDAYGERFDAIGGMMFKDGFLYKTVSIKSINAQNIKPTLNELEKFRKPGESGDSDVASLSTLFANRKKGHFMKGDAVIVVKGDLKKLKGWVEKVDEDNVHIRPELKGLPKTLAVNERELCKYFEPGNHVKVVTGAQEGATGMVVKVEQHVLILLSDTTKEHIRVFADDVVESSEVTTGITKIGDYELRDLVLLDNMDFGVIIRVESEAFQVLKGTADRPEVALVKLREIKCKIEKKINAQDKHKNTVSVKDVVRVVEGPCHGKSGPVEHIFRGFLFIYDRHHLEHAGFICARAGSCMVVGGSRSSGDRNGDAYSRFPGLRTPPRIPQSPRRFSRGGPPIDSGGRHRGGRGHDGLAGATVKVRQGAYKGYRGRVIEVKGTTVRVELESQMKVVTVDRNHISDNVAVTPQRETRYSIGCETPMHPSRTPLHPYMTPMRDPGATPIHDGMRTPRRDRAWNPYTPMSPTRDWEDGNPGSWGTSPQSQAGSSPSRLYEAPTPGAGWGSTPGGNYNEAGTPHDSYVNVASPYLPSTPGGQPMTPNSAVYLPSTPGGPPMTPGTGGLDMMSPVLGGDNEGPWFMPDILVNVHRPGEESVGVIREVLPDGSCKVALGSSGNGETITALPNEMEAVVPRKSDKIKIMGGALRGSTGKLIGVDGTDGIVKVDDTLEVKILDLVILAKLAQP
ncbi:hypothetical protein Ahy_A07g033903 isoform C [Arachis hypogaea]|uniref:Transcription elongation factor SPT5 n=1 Tax=Arachis hypogaea TaxID=3818 RepID=A0A445CAG4_ARAHY|nr:hypothetical protein Ahy_A07g033903 isoform C [Arachis hypogaea]